jgi:flavin-binding protein dodecin
MKSTKRKPAGHQRAVPTGRDGAVDLLARSELLNPGAMSSGDDHVYRVIEVVGTSKKSIEDAISNAVGRASATLHNLRWFEIIRSSGHIEGRAVSHFQVTLKVGFTLDEVR